MIINEHSPLTTQSEKAKQTSWQPRQILLFSGHMVDVPNRPTPRFPFDKVPLVEAEIAKVLDTFAANPDDLALTQGACGGDLIFAEACQARGVKLQLMQPFPEAEFLKRSIDPAAGDWRRRYFTVKAKLTEPVLCLSNEFQTESDDPFERCNLWLLSTALSYGADKVTFICLWNGEGGDGRGGTAHMMEHVKNHMGRVVWLDTRTLW